MKNSDKVYFIVRWTIITCTCILGLLSVITFARHFKKPDAPDNRAYESDDTVGKLQNFQMLMRNVL